MGTKRLYWGYQGSGGSSGGGTSPPRRSVSMCFCIFSVIQAGGMKGFSSSSRRSTESLGRKKGEMERLQHPLLTPNLPCSLAPISTKPRPNRDLNEHWTQSNHEPQPTSSPNLRCPTWPPGYQTPPITKPRNHHGESRVPPTQDALAMQK